MEAIERCVILTFKYAKVFFLKYASPILIYLYFLLIGRLLIKTYQVYNYRFGTITLLYFSGFMAHLIYNEILRENIHKILIGILLLVSLCYLARYGVEHKYFIEAITHLKEAFNIIYNGEKVDFNLIRQIICAGVPILSFTFLTLDRNGKGESIIVLFFILASNAYYYDFNQKSNLYLVAYVYLTVLYFSISYYKKISSKARLKKIKFLADRNSVISFALCLSLIIATMAYASVEFFGTQNIGDISAKLQRKLIKYEDKGKKSIYTISTSGFGSDTKLGGPIKLNQDIAFRVKSDKPYYLRGTVKDTYDGFKWTYSSDRYFLKGSRGIFKADANYIKYMLGYKPEAKIDDKDAVLTSKSITIYPENLKTSTLFSPYNTFNIRSGRDYIGYTYEKTFMLLNKHSPENYYTASFYESLNGVENFINSKNRSIEIDYDVSADDRSTIEDYENKVKKPYAPYLALPNNISKEIYNLVATITKDSFSTKEKVQKIYDFLNSNYKYSLDVSEIPKDEEFLHYFLFKEKKGYCTYFATASVVFCRIAGIPARYVEGFRMDGSKDPNGLYAVGNSKAHAWAEILISNEHNIWGVLDTVPSQENVITDDHNNIPENSKIEDWIKEEASMNSSKGNNAFKGLEENEFYSKEIVTTNHRGKVYLILKLLLYLLPFGLCAYSIISIYLKIRNYKNFKAKLLDADSIIPLYIYSKQRLTLIGHNCPPNSSEMEYIESIKDSHLKNQLKAIATLYNEEYYGDRKCHDFDKRKYYNFIEEYIKNLQNPVYYYYHKYLKT